MAFTTAREVSSHSSMRFVILLFPYVFEVHKLMSETTFVCVALITGEFSAFHNLYTAELVGCCRDTIQPFSPCIMVNEGLLESLAAVQVAVSVG